MGWALRSAPVWTRPFLPLTNMTHNPFRLLFASILGGLAGGLPSGQAVAQGVVATDPVGVLALPLAAQRDTRVTIPFVRPARYAGLLQSVSGNVLTVAGAPGWNANQFAYDTGTGQHDTFFDQFAYDTGTGQHDTFFVLLGAQTGAGTTPKEGGFYTVTANGTNTLTVDLNGDSLATVQPDTRLTLIPYWTLGTAFPASDMGHSFLVSASPAQKATLVLPASARNVVSGDPGEFTVDPTAAYYFYAGAWRRGDLDPGVVCDDDVLFPDGHLVVRNPDAATLTLRPVGVVLTAKFTVPVPTPGVNAELDYPVALPRPVDVSLNDLGLISSGIILPTGVSANSQNSVAVFNPTAGYDPPPAATYYFAEGAWRKTGAPPTQDFGTDMIPAGAGFLLHLGAGDGATRFWTNSPNYLNE